MFLENMKKERNYIDINRQDWNRRVEIHLKSDFYDLKSFVAGKSSLNDIELDLLDDVKGKCILHLQCHFGQDTISLARLGVKCTGVDLSDEAINSARELAGRTGVAVTFVCCDLYELPDYLSGQFDIVFTSYGTIGWLPDMEKWAKVIAHFLKPNGRFIFVEFHPVVWMFDEKFKEISYSYFNSGPIYETETGTYADRDAGFTFKSISWNHGMSEVVNSLIRNGLEIIALNEYDYSPYNIFSDLVEYAPGRYRLRRLGDKLPLVYAVKAIKKRTKAKTNC